MTTHPPVRGRGTPENPTGRFETLTVSLDPEHADGKGPRTVFLKDASRTILSRNESPDIPFVYGLNPYRGCEHGCVYCYARPYHEYLGFSAGLDFESRILVKEDAPRLLQAELAKPTWVPTPIALAGVTDAYQPVEKVLRLTRGCLEVLAACRHPVGIVTKSRLVLRDLDLLEELASFDAVGVCVTITSLDPDLAAALEPRAARPAARLDAVRALAKAGLAPGVLVAPVIPGLTDHEIPALLEAASDAGAAFAGYEVLRLPHGVKDLFAAWLERHHPDRRDKVLNRIRDLRGGQLTDARFGTRMRGEGPFAEQIRQLFQAGARRAGLSTSFRPLATHHVRPPAVGQLRLF